MVEQHDLTLISQDGIEVILRNFDELPPLVEIPEGAWEYKVFTAPSSTPELAEQALSMLGLQLWELVHVQLIESPFGNEFWYYMKRLVGVNNGISTSEES